MAYKKWNDNLFIDGQMVMEYNIDDYITKTEEQLLVLKEHKAKLKQNVIR